MVGMRVREHDRGRRDSTEAVEPIRAAINHDPLALVLYQ